MCYSGHRSNFALIEVSHVPSGTDKYRCPYVLLHCLCILPWKQKRLIRSKHESPNKGWVGMWGVESSIDKNLEFKQVSPLNVGSTVNFWKFCKYPLISHYRHSAVTNRVSWTVQFFWIGTKSLGMYTFLHFSTLPLNEKIKSHWRFVALLFTIFCDVFNLLRKTCSLL